MHLASVASPPKPKSATFRSLGPYRVEIIDHGDGTVWLWDLGMESRVRAAGLVPCRRPDPLCGGVVCGLWVTPDQPLAMGAVVRGRLIYLPGGLSLDEEVRRGPPVFTVWEVTGRGG